jgi:hypothetical protein
MWLFTPVVDYLCVGSLTFLVFLPVLILNVTTPTPRLVNGLLVWGSILVNFPHYAATYYRVYRDTNQVRRYSVQAVWVPALLSVVAAACFLFPDRLTPWVAFVYLTASGYHYAGQTYGVSMIFIGKSGLRLTRWQKRMLLLPIYSSYLYTLVGLNVVDRVPLQVFDTVVPTLNLPHEALEVAKVLVLLSVALFVGFNMTLSRTQARMVPSIVNVTIAAQIVWFTTLQYPILVAIVPLFHCLQYLLITGFFDFKEARAREGDMNLSPAKYFASSLFPKYYATQVVIGFCIFVVLPFLLIRLGVGSEGIVGAVVISMVNLHHFILDGAIWKLRQPNVRTPLLT